MKEFDAEKIWAEYRVVMEMAKEMGNVISSRDASFGQALSAVAVTIAAMGATLGKLGTPEDQDRFIDTVTLTLRRTIDNNLHLTEDGGEV